MLSPNQVVKIREAIEAWYTDKCNITGTKKVQNGSITSFEDDIIAENQPCRLAFSNIQTTTDADGSSMINQTVKLFISPDIDIKPGCNIEVIRGDKIMMYKCSGMPAIYDTHQEIVLDALKERA